jgi:hypothetical protein
MYLLLTIPQPLHLHSRMKHHSCPIDRGVIGSEVVFIKLLLSEIDVSTEVNLLFIISI